VLYSNGAVDTQHCGEERRLCVRVDTTAGHFGKQSDCYVIHEYWPTRRRDDELGLVQALDVTKLIQISLQYVTLQVEGAASSFANDVDEAGQRQFANMVRHRLAFDVVQRHQVAERDAPSVRGNLLENLHTTWLRKHLGHVGKLLCGKPVL